MTTNKYRYYSLYRPFGPGTYPKHDGTENIVNFDNGRIYCEEIKRAAWGFIEYSEPLTDSDVDKYELVRGTMSTLKVKEGYNGDKQPVAFLIS